MRQSVPFLPVLALIVLSGQAGCANNRGADSYAQIDGDFIDDGTDYYAAAAQTDESLSIYRKQWIVDENGNRVYTMNTHEALGGNHYYVGDIRYLPNRQEPDREPLYYDRWGYPIYQLNGSYSGNAGRYPYGYGISYPSRSIQHAPSQTSSTSTNTTTPPRPSAPIARPAPVARPAPSRLRNYRNMDSPRQRPRAPSDVRRTHE